MSAPSTNVASNSGTAAEANDVLQPRLPSPGTTRAGYYGYMQTPGMMPAPGPYVQTTRNA